MIIHRKGAGVVQGCTAYKPRSKGRKEKHENIFLEKPLRSLRLCGEKVFSKAFGQLEDMAKLFIFSAASGTGKTSLAHELMKRVPHLALSVSHTTRAPRPGRDPRRALLFREPRGVRGHGRARRVYRTRAGVRQPLWHRAPDGRRPAQGGQECDFRYRLAGARAIKSKMPEGRERLHPAAVARGACRASAENRRQDAPEVIAKRMAAAVSEISHYREFDYVVVNDDFEAARADLETIVTGKGHPRPVSIDTAALLGDQWKIPPDISKIVLQVLSVLAGSRIPGLARQFPRVSQRMSFDYYSR